MRSRWLDQMRWRSARSCIRRWPTCTRARRRYAEASAAYERALKVSLRSVDLSNPLRGHAARHRRGHGRRARPRRFSGGHGTARAPTTERSRSGRSCCWRRRERRTGDLDGIGDGRAPRHLGAGTRRSARASLHARRDARGAGRFRTSSTRSHRPSRCSGMRCRATPRAPSQCCCRTLGSPISSSASTSKAIASAPGTPTDHRRRRLPSRFT